MVDNISRQRLPCVCNYDCTSRHGSSLVSLTLFLNIVRRREGCRYGVPHQSKPNDLKVTPRSFKSLLTLRIFNIPY